MNHDMGDLKDVQMLAGIDIDEDGRIDMIA